MPPYQPPQQPSYPPQGQAPQSGSPDPYHFILNPEQPKGPSSVGRPVGILFIVGAVAVVIILLVVILNIARGGGTDSKPLLTVAQEQQEIGRVAGLDIDQLPDGNIKNFVLTTKLTMSTDSASYTSYLGKHGVKVSQKQLALGKNATTDAELANAISTNSLDTTLQSILQNELQQYQTDLAKAYRSTSGTATRTVLKQLNNNAQLLLAQSKQ